ncbi:FAD-dependent monooxygenase [Novosphingobium sp. BL-8H]|uniref:FAD-dependent monooxygenase n=1 Tax=Novosphingobium sp. BL-8H TaxID=3127640 RepID=UPI003757AFD3
MPPTYHDVIIAGAGPVGLFLATELRLRGCSVLVLERAADASSPLKHVPFGLRGLSIPSIDAFDRRDMLDALKTRMVGRDEPAAAHWLRQERRPAGHFAGIQFFRDRIDTGHWPYRLSGAIDTITADMAGVEAVLTARANTMGVEIRHDCSVEDFEQSVDDIVVHAGAARFRCGWLVGSDGARSAVRKAAGIGFTGTDPEFTGYSVQAELADPDRLNPGRHYTSTGMYTYARPGIFGMVDFDGGACHRAAPITRAHVETVLRRVTGTDVTVNALTLAATWTDRAFQATAYRQGRVLLAGDAAHIHSPLGGQGLNLGLGDAMNLGWKLAATIRGKAPPDLLDSYERERHLVGARVLDWSRAQVALMRPAAASRALEAIIRDLIDTPDGATYFADRFGGAGLRYDLGGDHPLVGLSAPDFRLQDGSRVNEHLRDGCGLLLDFGANAALRALAARFGTGIDYLSADAEDRLGLSAMLVRPDGFVAWASDGADIDGAFQAATLWFGQTSRHLETPAG